MNPFSDLSPIWPEDLQPANFARAQASGKTIVVLDDDPTGTQTVYDVPVLTTWEPATLGSVFAEGHPLVYILTNTRAFPSERAAEITRDIVASLETTGHPVTVISRSDSTLRGHFPLETDLLKTGDAPLLLVPFFEEGGRLTVDGTHFVVEGDKVTPVADTPFASDPAFGFTESFLPRYVEEKTAGRTRSQDVVIVPLKTIREDGPEGVAEILRSLAPNSICAVDAVRMRDLEVAAAAVWICGRPFVHRSAASWVRALAGLPKRELCSREELVPRSPQGGLIVAGSYVPKTTAQLANLKIDSIELDVTSAIEAQIPHIAARADAYIAGGSDVLVYTSRSQVGADDANRGLDTGKRVSQALCSVLKNLTQRPRYIIAKGGITSSDLATEALGVRRAQVLGQALPGVPAWKLGKETKFPGITYIVFPGNVGDEHALSNLVTKLSQK